MGVTPRQTVEAIQDWGVDFRPYPFTDKPWHEATTAGGWSPIGILHHHTTGPNTLIQAGWNQDKGNMLRLLRAGRPGLDGPLCHFAPTFMGNDKRVVYGIGWANCNHAGEGRASVANAVRTGSFTGGLTGSDSVDGNPLFWGLEYLHPGLPGVAWPDALLDTGHRVAAALCEAHGWRPDSWAGSNAEHREWSGRKVDRAWPGWGDGMRREITKLAASTTDKPEVDGWVRSESIRVAIKHLVEAASLKEEAGRKIQAEALREHVRELRKQFPVIPN